MRILATAGDVDSLITEIRLRTPLSSLAQAQGWTVHWRSFHECSQSDLAAADLVIVQRGASRRSCRIEERALEGGATVVYEIDDLLTEIAPHISQHAAVRASLPWLRSGLGQADLVTVSTPRLQRELASLARATAVVPNHAFFDEDRPLPPQWPGERVHLLVASSDHLLDSDLTRALRGVVGERARLVVVGPPADALAAMGLPLQRHPLLPRREFVALARSLPNAVALIPLEASRFAACKSAIKWYDYAEAGIPTLASAVPPYLDAIEHGRTGLLVDNSEAQWLRALHLVIDEVDVRRRIAAQARAVVRERHGLPQTIAAWQTALLLARQLRRARQVRAPRGPAAWWRAAGDATSDWAVTLRRWNRQRLAHRRGASPR
ncbi:MAG: glycosyltransferase [Rubrivivax sp.]|nr:glycosyltransferase [Rubrivivax sp.]